MLVSFSRRGQLAPHGWDHGLFLRSQRKRWTLVIGACILTSAVSSSFPKKIALLRIEQHFVLTSIFTRTLLLPFNKLLRHLLPSLQLSSWEMDLHRGEEVSVLSTLPTQAKRWAVKSGVPNEHSRYIRSPKRQHLEIDVPQGKLLFSTPLACWNKLIPQHDGIPRRHIRSSHANTGEFCDIRVLFDPRNGIAPVLQRHGTSVHKLHCMLDDHEQNFLRYRTDGSTRIQHTCHRLCAKVKPSLGGIARRPGVPPFH